MAISGVDIKKIAGQVIDSLGRSGNDPTALDELLTRVADGFAEVVRDSKALLGLDNRTRSNAFRAAGKLFAPSAADLANGVQQDRKRLLTEVATFLTRAACADDEGYHANNHSLV